MLQSVKCYFASAAAAFYGLLNALVLNPLLLMGRIFIQKSANHFLILSVMFFGLFFEKITVWSGIPCYFPDFFLNIFLPTLIKPSIGAPFGNLSSLSGSSSDTVQISTY